MFSHPPDAHGIKAACGVDPLSRLRLGGGRRRTLGGSVAFIGSSLERAISVFLCKGELYTLAAARILGSLLHSTIS